MATPVLITIDTEMSLAQHQAGVEPEENFASSIMGTCAAGSFGIGWQMGTLEACGLTAVFFVDPMPALAYGTDMVARIVEPIVARGHAVELHLHAEWLSFVDPAFVDPAFVAPAPVQARGRNIGDFALADQIALIERARESLMEAGAPEPTAFRAGNYGANDDTLRALAALGVRYDSSFNAAYAGRGSDISGAPVDAVAQVPVGVIRDARGLRTAQVCALSSREMRAALNHAADRSAPFVTVSHSFEMLSRDRSRPNRQVMRRFEAMCEHVAAHPGLKSGTFRESPDTDRARPPLPASWPRTAARMVEQAWGRLRYE